MGSFKLFSWECMKNKVSVYVAIYQHCVSKSSTTASPKITSLYISQSHQLSLICISSNSAATNVIWKRNGYNLIIDEIIFDSSQTVVDTVQSTYENKLIFLTSEIPPGLYTCTVMNDHGNATSADGILRK